MSVKCPKCGHNQVVKVGPFIYENGSIDVGFLMENGQCCCSLHCPHFETMEEAHAYANKYSFEQWCVDEDTSWKRYEVFD